LIIRWWFASALSAFLAIWGFSLLFTVENTVREGVGSLVKGLIMWVAIGWIYPVVLVLALAPVYAFIFAFWPFLVRCTEWIEKTWTGLLVASSLFALPFATAIAYRKATNVEVTNWNRSPRWSQRSWR
jgi:hypothetical protein